MLTPPFGTIVTLLYLHCQFLLHFFANSIAPSLSSNYLEQGGLKEGDFLLQELKILNYTQIILKDIMTNIYPDRN
jgi:hypothetical protein